MKITLLSSVIFFIIGKPGVENPVFGQVSPPAGINYQAVARDAGGNPLAVQTVTVSFDIHQTTAAGISVYSETQTATTNAYRLFSLVIGSVSPNTFLAVPWGSDQFFLEVTVNGTGMGTTQFFAVPYAYHSATADSIVGGPPPGAFIWQRTADSVYLGVPANRVGIGTSSPKQKLHIIDPSSMSPQVMLETSAGAFNLGYRMKSAGGEWLLGKETGEFDLFKIKKVSDNFTGFSLTGGLSPKVGIGTNNPQDFFHIRPDKDFTFDSSVVVTAEGRMGIGAIAPSAQKMQVATSSSIAAGTDMVSFAHTNSSATPNIVNRALNILVNGTLSGASSTNRGLEINVSNAMVNSGLVVTATAAAGQFTLPGVFIANDNNTSSVTNALSIRHLPSGSAAAGIGTGLEFSNANAGGSLLATGRITNYMGNVTAGSEQSKLGFYTMNAGSLSEKMTLDNAGNLGIGALVPGAKLEVNGQVKITGGSPANGAVLTSDAAGLAVWSASPLSSHTLYAASGTYVFTVPANVYKLMIEVWGGGGGGSGAAGLAAGGGGGGGYGKQIVTVTPGTNYTVTVGTGGNGGAAGAGGAAGTSSSVNTTPAVSATGGNGGGNTGTGGAGGSSTATINIGGGSGCYGGTNFISYGGIGGNGGSGGLGGIPGTPPAAGISPGGGGGGAYAGSGTPGGSGAVGRVVIWW